MIAAALGALLSHWRRHPFQLATLLLGLAAATALWSGVQAINAEARRSYDRAAATLTGGGTVIEREGRALTMADFTALRRGGWPVTPLLEGRLGGFAGEIALIGIDPFTLEPSLLPPGLRPEPRAEGDPRTLDPRFVSAEGLLLAGPDTARRLSGLDGLPPVAEVPGLAEGAAYADLPVAQRLLGRPEAVGRLVLTGRASLTHQPLDQIAGSLRLRERRGGADLARLTDSFHLNLTAFGLLSFAVGLFIVRGAVGLAYEQRRQMLRTLGALGLPRGHLVGLMLGELLVLALPAGVIGVALGWAVAALLLPDVAATLRGLYGAEIDGALSLEPTWWLSGLAIAVLGTLLAAAGTLWRVARLPVLAPAQPRAWARASAQVLRWQLAAAALLVLGGWAAVTFFDGLIAGFALMGGLLLAAALALPALLHAVLAGGARLARGPLTEWFWADTRQQLPGLGLALMALLLALSANIGVGTMVSSFRATFTGWLDQRLAAELYVTAPSDARGAEIADWLAPRVDAVLPIRSVPARLSDRPAEIFGVADHETYRRNWPLIAQSPRVWDRVAAGEAVLINEQLARAEDLWPGDSIALPDGRALIGGVYSDYGNPEPQVMMGLPRFQAAFPRAPNRRFALRVAPESAAGLATRLRQRFDLPSDAITDQAAAKSLSLRIFERTFAVTAALNVLTLAVAGLAILTSLLTLSQMRLPQIAPVWASGVTRDRLALLDLGRAALLAGLIWIAAVPVGLLLAWVLLAVVNVEAFGWRLPMAVFPGDLLILLAASLVAAALAGLWPARRIARLTPAELLKVFAHER